MSRHRSDAAAITGAFIDAMNRREHEEAARYLADDAEIVLPGARLEGRSAWLESRRRQDPPEHLAEAFETDTSSATADGVEVAGRLVQTWVETGELANEMPVRIGFVIDGGLIQRLELRPQS
jgi:Domain of unknown function (DUF4440)